MTCPNCERMRAALVEIDALAVYAEPGGTGAKMLAIARAALAPASEPPDDVVEQARVAALDAFREAWHDRPVDDPVIWRGVALAAIAAICDPAAEVRAVLREVLACWSHNGRVLPADLRKRAEEVCR